MLSGPNIFGPKIKEFVCNDQSDQCKLQINARRVPNVGKVDSIPQN